MTAPGSNATAYRYIGEQEFLFLGPPIRVLSTGDVVHARVNPDPALFTAVTDAATGPGDSA
ncbi:MAG: hypothetical protein JJD92_01770 [Frankiaceae bacterium]|nr:hypothetical protein [Frankiaceae bacterium]